MSVKTAEVYVKAAAFSLLLIFLNERIQNDQENFLKKRSMMRLLFCQMTLAFIHFSQPFFSCFSRFIYFYVTSLIIEDSLFVQATYCFIMIVIHYFQSLIMYMVAFK